MHSSRRSIGEVAVMGVLRRLATSLLAVPGLVFLAGCATTMHFGAMPEVDRLPSLKIAVSSANDVVSALGEPRGRGQARFAPDHPEQQVWFYEYTQSEGKKVKLKMLLVFMEKDVYAGYMWFSSGQLLEARP